MVSNMSFAGMGALLSRWYGVFLFAMTDKAANGIAQEGMYSLEGAQVLKASRHERPLLYVLGFTIACAALINAMVTQVSSSHGRDHLSIIVDEGNTALVCNMLATCFGDVTCIHLMANHMPPW